ncbi:MAG TPA: TonB-dependent receptor [Azospirillaceae bacterium]|nr:TonB-dependent receptor [Azospirillaceae bacterium]
MSRKLSRRIMSTSSALAIAATGGLATPALAQLEEINVIPTIVVTAQKREENLNTVPVTLSVVSGDLLEKSGIQNTESLVTLVPTLTVRKGTTNVNSAINIRGIGTISFSAGAEPSVSTVLDGVVLARSGMAFNDLVDIQRIEVLRGPQGTLFGKNASAGVVNIVSKDPSRSPTANAEIGYYDIDELRLKSTVSGPITDELAARLSAGYAWYDGSADNVFNGKKVNGSERGGARGKLVWTPGETVKATFIADYMKADDDCCADIIGDAPAGAANDIILRPSLAPVVPGTRNRDIDNDLNPRTVDESWGMSGQIDWDLDAVTLTSITAYRGWYNKEIRDGDFRSDAPRFVFASAPGGDQLFHDNGTLDFSQFTQEFRLSSPSGERLEYTVGAFFYRTDQDNNFNRLVRRCTASALPANANGTIPCNTASTYQDFTGSADFNTQLTNYATFGQASFAITEPLKALFGWRLTKDRIEYDFRRVSNSTANAPGINAGFANSGDTEKTKFTLKTGLSYQVTDEVMVYGTYAQGYKGPAFNIFFNMTANDTTPVPPEKSDAFEIGMKNQILGDRLVLNLAAFHSKYDGFQANSFVTVAGAIVSSLGNAGQVVTKGVEADIIAVPVKNLTVTGGVSYTDAYVKEAFCPPGSPAACLTRNGTDLPYSPDWKFSFNADYLIPTGESLPFDMIFNTTYAWQSAQQFDLFSRAQDTAQESYGTWDVALTFADKEDRYAITASVQNITDEYFTTAKVRNGTFIRYQVPREAQRIMGVRARVNF